MPFNFLGTLTDSQKRDLSAWVRSRYSDIDGVTEAHKVRAAQLRRTSGILQEFYKGKNLITTFSKEAIKEPDGGFDLLEDKDDRDSAIVVRSIKDGFQRQLEVEDEAVFQLNNLAVLIEKSEDQAHIVSGLEIRTEDLLKQLDALFSDPANRDVLISDSDTFEGSPRFRTSSLEEKTPYEESISPSLKG